MDLALYARVLWRFRWLVVAGALLATVLSALSIVSVGFDGVKYRQAELWSSTTRIGVTQRGFPWGRLLAQDPNDDEENRGPSGIPLADPARLNSLAFLYSQLATSDEVRRVLRRDGPILGRIVADPVIVGEVRWVLPLVDITAIATSRGGAVRLAERSARALETYIRERQRADRVPPVDRVVLEQVRRPGSAELHQPRPKTMPVLIFASVLFAFVGLAFVLENARLRARGSIEEDDPASELGDALQRRTA